MKCPKCQADNPDTKQFCGDCGTQLISKEKPQVSFTKTLETPVEELTRGTTFAQRYEIIEELGKGGMGRVYRVEDTKLKQEVALKLIRPEISSDKKTIDRFQNELKTARMIAHKNVCRMFDLGEAEGSHFITMEYVRGEDLKSMVRMSGQLGIGTAINIAKHVCEGLAEAHRLGVVHRDLKPSNIMIDKEGNARIMDFGIARSLKGKGITGAGVMIGTPEYMSPEQVEGKEVDQRSDIYSLGVILYEMVTGQVPFEGDTPFTVGVKHKSEVPRNPKEFNARIPDDLSLLILKCLEKVKEKRFQSAGELRSELSSIEKGIPTTERKIPKRKPLTSKEITVTFGLKKLLIPGIIVIAVIIIGVILWQLLLRKEAVSIPTDKPSVAVMYFKNNTGDQGLDIWRTALSDSLITDLSQSKLIRVLSADRLYTILKQMNLLEATNYTSEDLGKIASRGRVNHILQGHYSKAGDNFRIEITLQDVNTLELVGSERVEGRGEKSIFSMVDELTRRIKADFELTEEQIASDLDKEVGKITTASPEAYKLYVEGRRYHKEGNPTRSAGSMQKAVAIDPEFAMAYRSMAIAFGNMGFGPASRKAIQKAFELSDRASERERYTIQGDYYRQSEKTYDKAVEAFNKLLELYPEDFIGNVNLGIVYNNLEEWDKAIQRFMVLINIKSESHFPYANITISLMAKGLYEEAAEVAEDYLNNISYHYTLSLYLVYIYAHQGKYDLALSEWKKVFSALPSSIPPIVLLIPRARIYLLKGNIAEAEKEFLNIQQSTDALSAVSGKRGLANLYLMQGKFDRALDQLQPRLALREPFAFTYVKYMNPAEALEEIDKLLKDEVKEENFPIQRKALHLKGLVHLRMGSMAEALRAAEELKELIETGINKKKIRLYHHLMGLIELEKEDFSKAIEYLKKASSSLPYQCSFSDADHALYIDPLAVAYYKSGDLARAQEEYKKITFLTSGRLFYGDIYIKGFYKLGKIHEQQGNKDKAIEHYEKFLDLWKDADPGIAEVEDARERLAVLRK